MSTTAGPALTHRRSMLALGTLALGAFVIGTAELVVVGVLNLVASDLAVSVSTAGLLVTTYALGISIGGPLVTMLTIRLGRRFLLRAALAAYVGGNLLAVAAVNFNMLLLARVLTGTIHGLFIGVASAVAGSLVPPQQQGRAISMVFGGIAVSTVLGVPLGTLVAQAAGWRAAFVGIVILGVLALILTLVFIPPVHGSGSGGFGAQSRAAFAPRVLALLGVGFLLLGGQFTAFTYLVPFLGQLSGVTGGAVSAFLLIFGVSSAVGMVIGGRFADRSATRTLIVANAALVAALAVLYLVAANPVLVAVTLCAWGVAGFGLIPALQLRVISLAGAGGDLAATLGASAVNAGIAVGAVIGGLAVTGHGVRSVAVVGLLICAVALPLTWATSRLQPVPTDAPTAPTAPEAPDGWAGPVDPDRMSDAASARPAVPSG